MAARHPEYREIPGSGSARPQSGRLCLTNPYHRNFLSGPGGGLHALLRDRWHHVGLGAHGRVRQCAGESRSGAGGLFLRVLPGEGAEGKGSSISAGSQRVSRTGTICARRRAGKRPVDGHYVTFWRILLRYPEILAWEQFWHDDLRETYAAMYQKVKSIKPEVLVGWHIWHNISFSPFYRAQQDLRSSPSAPIF